MARSSLEQVRKARPADLPRCAALFAAALEEMDARRGGTLLSRHGPFTGTAREAIDTLTELAAVDDPDQLVLAGLFDDAVVGVARGHVERRDDQVLGVVDLCFVEPSARDVGVGGALLQHLVGWFVTQRCSGVDALALPGDRQMKQLLETAGFKTRLLVLHRPLE